MPIDNGEVIGLLACPIDGSALSIESERLRCAFGHTFPIVENVPVLLRGDVEQNIGLANQSLKSARDWAQGRRDDPLFIETLGVSEEEKQGVRVALSSGESRIDPVISFVVGATNGILYKDRLGRLDRVPLPEVRLPPDSNGGRLLDIGCSWGRWSMAAAVKGYRPVGVDPSLGAVLAAKRLAESLGLPFDGVVADARYLPFKKDVVDAAFSYSVLQHFSKVDARRALDEIARVTCPGGTVKIQMASATGIRSLQHILRRRFRESEGFEVRYWMPQELHEAFRQTFGNAKIEVDCYFGLGLQPSDAALYSAVGRAAVRVSEVLRGMSEAVWPLAYVADSVYLSSRNEHF